MAKPPRVVQRAREQAAHIGREIRLARRIGGLSVVAAAGRARVSTSTWYRVEAGDPAAALVTLAACAEAVALNISARAYPRSGGELRDRRQARVAQRLTELTATRWKVALEVPAGDHGEAIDLCLFGSTELVAVEIETVLADWQAQYRRAALKRDWLAAHHVRPVRLVITVLDTPRNRMTISPFAGLVGSVLPAKSRAVMAALRTGAPLGTDGVLWMRPIPTRSATDR